MHPNKFKLREFSYFVVLADCLNFSQAAERCSVSQPTLSVGIRKFEDTLGTTLIERKAGQVMLTDTGQKVADQARIILQEVDVLAQMVAELKDPFSGTIRIGIIPTVSPYLLSHLIGELQKAFPELDAHYIEAKTPELEDQLKEGGIDAAVLALPAKPTNLTTLSLYRERFYLAAPKNHPLADRPWVETKDLQQIELLLLEEGHCFRDQALEVCRQANAIQNMNFSATSIETLKYMVGAGLGLTLVPEMAARNKDNAISYIPFNPPIYRDIGIVCRRSTTRISLLEELSETIKAKIQDLFLPKD